LGLTESLEVEPALKSIAHRLVGGIFSPVDEAGDAYLFSKALAGAPWESLQYYPLRDFWRDGKQMISA